MQRIQVIALVALAAAATAGAAQPGDPDFAPLGGSFGQTMRIQISAVPPDPCMVTAGFRTGATSPPVPDATLKPVWRKP